MELKIEEEILSTNDWGIFRILNEKLINGFELAIGKLKEDEDISVEVSEIREILASLITIFRLGEEDNNLKKNLREIYLFVNKTVTSGYIERDWEKFMQSKNIINPIYEGFKEKEMSETAKIVSGLTYGERDLDKHGDNSKLNIQG